VDIALHATAACCLSAAATAADERPPPAAAAAAPSSAEEVTEQLDVSLLFHIAAAAASADDEDVMMTAASGDFAAAAAGGSNDEPFTPEVLQLFQPSLLHAVREAPPLASTHSCLLRTTGWVFSRLPPTHPRSCRPPAGASPPSTVREQRLPQRIIAG
jgi:hypothetical protein